MYRKIYRQISIIGTSKHTSVPVDRPTDHSFLIQLGIICVIALSRAPFLLHSVALYIRVCILLFFRLVFARCDTAKSCYGLVALISSSLNWFLYFFLFTLYIFMPRTGSGHYLSLVFYNRQLLLTLLVLSFVFVRSELIVVIVDIC